MMFGKLGVSTTEQNESSSDWAPPTVFAFGVHSEPQRFQLESLFDHLNIESKSEKKILYLICDLKVPNTTL